MSEVPFKCVFQIKYCSLLLTAGVMECGGNFSKEQLRTDDSTLSQVLDKLSTTLMGSIPLLDSLNRDDIEIIMYLPDLIN